MNNRQSNRRRGRGNNRPQNNNRGGGFDHQNSIDNRARGNASQMLEKFKKQANDAQLNGDRVNAESYLQFADHYFRVLADYRLRQEAKQEAREQRDDSQNSNNQADKQPRNENNRPENGGHNNVSDNDSRNDKSDDDRGNTEKKPVRAKRVAKADAVKKPRMPRKKPETIDTQDDGSIDIAILPPALSIDSAEAEKPKKRAPRKKIVKKVAEEKSDNIETAE